MAGKTHEYGATRIFLYTLDGVNPDVLLSAVDAVNAVRSPKGGAWSVVASVGEYGGGPALSVTVHARDHHGCLRRGRHALRVALGFAGVCPDVSMLRDISKPAPHMNRGKYRAVDSPAQGEDEDEQLVL